MEKVTFGISRRTLDAFKKTCDELRLDPKDAVMKNCADDDWESHEYVLDAENVARFALGEDAEGKGAI